MSQALNSNNLITLRDRTYYTDLYIFSIIGQLETAQSLHSFALRNYYQKIPNLPCEFKSHF